jgi:hypothetical protein
MSGWRKRQIQERQHMEFTSDDPNYGRVYYSINPNIDWSKIYYSSNKVVNNELIDEMLVEGFLEKGDFTEANEIIDRIRNVR